MSAGWKDALDRLIVPAVERSAAIDAVLIDHDALARTGERFRALFGERPALVIADTNTIEAAGHGACASLEAASVTHRTHLLKGDPRLKPTRALGDELAALIRSEGESAIPVAVGSGVINDLVKYAAFTAGRAYACIATAASMDGYTSAGSPLVEDGFKHTIPCAAPRLVIADLAVIASAPPAMIGWGYGDVAGKMPAGGDWMIADALGIEPIDDRAWPLVQDNLRDWLAEPAAIRAGEPERVANLTAGLMVGGIAMEFHGSSRPASGADHQIAHLWEMEGRRHEGQPLAHGACVAIGTLAVLSLFDWLLGQDLSDLDAERLIAGRRSMRESEALIQSLFETKTVALRAIEETRIKRPDDEGLRARLERLARVWPDLRTRLERRLMRAPEMKALLAAAGAPVTTGELGFDKGHLLQTISRARFVRRRYTILDLLDECALFERALDHVAVA